MKHVKFILFSILGIILFLVPIPINGTTTVMLGHLNSFVKDNIMDEILLFGLVLSAVTFVLTFVGTVIKPDFITKSEYLNKMFKVNILTFISRILGAVFFGLIYFEVGPELLIGENTGGLILSSFIGGLIVTFTIGNLILPLLTEFGLLEFLGSLLRKVMRKLFKVPGRSAIDAVASTVGDGTLGILVTDEQYTKGFYTRREAVTIATTFSIVGIAFTTLVAGELGFGDKFLLFYGTIIFVTIINAIIIPRLPIMKKYENEYNPETGKKITENDSSVSLSIAYMLATDKAKKTDIIAVYKKMFKSIFNIYMTFIPIIIFVGTVALMTTEIEAFSRVYEWISYPLYLVYDLLNIPDAKIAAQASIIGFTDMYLPALFIMDSPHEITRFIVGTLSFTQLIFLAETGSILLKTKFKMSFFDVLMFFLIRTLISIPIIVLIAKILF